MIIGINALYLLPGKVGGTEIYLRSILPELVKAGPAHRFVVFLNSETESLLESENSRVQEIHCRVPASSRTLRILYEQTVLPVLVRRLGVQVLLNAGFTAPVCLSIPQVTAVHDLQHKIHPQFFRRFDLPFWNLLVWAAVRRSKMLLTFSARTGTDIMRIYGVAQRVIAVAPHGVDEEMFRVGKDTDRSASRMILCVSTLHPHKNLDRLLTAFAEFRKSHEDYQLVVVGLHGFAANDLVRLCNELHLNDSVTFTGWIPRDTLYQLFASARAFIYPSLFEGFGLPVLEALAAGIPTACSAIEPLTQIAGQAALLFDSGSIDEIISALEKLLQFDGSSGPRQARLFSWESAARATLAALEACYSAERPLEETPRLGGAALPPK